MEEPINVVLGDKVWTANSSLIEGELWDVPFIYEIMLDLNQAGPVESQAVPNQVQIVDSTAFRVVAYQGLEFWEGL